MVDTSGRMVIPSKVRQELGIEGGGELMVTMENGLTVKLPVASAAGKVDDCVLK